MLIVKSHGAAFFFWGGGGGGGGGVLYLEQNEMTTAPKVVKVCFPWKRPYWTDNKLILLAVFPPPPNEVIYEKLFLEINLVFFKKLGSSK